MAWSQHVGCTCLLLTVLAIVTTVTHTLVALVDNTIDIEGSGPIGIHMVTQCLACTTAHLPIDVIGWVHQVGCVDLTVLANVGTPTLTLPHCDVIDGD